VDVRLTDHRNIAVEIVAGTLWRNIDDAILSRTITRRRNVSPLRNRRNIGT